MQDDEVKVCPLHTARCGGISENGRVSPEASVTKFA